MTLIPEHLKEKLLTVDPASAREKINPGLYRAKIHAVATAKNSRHNVMVEFHLHAMNDAKCEAQHKGLIRKVFKLEDREYGEAELADLMALMAAAGMDNDSIRNNQVSGDDLRGQIVLVGIDRPFSKRDDSFLNFSQIERGNYWPGETDYRSITWRPEAPHFRAQPSNAGRDPYEGY